MRERGEPQEFYEVVSASSLESFKERQNLREEMLYRSEAIWRIRKKSSLNGRLDWPSKIIECQNEKFPYIETHRKCT